MKRAFVLSVAAAVVLTLAACGNDDKSSSGDRSASASDTIVGVLWQWTGSKENHPASLSAVPDPSRYLLTLNDDGTFNAKVDCNMVSGSYTLSGSDLSLEPGPSTLAACPEDSLADLYLAGLTKVESYSVANGQLDLALADNAGTMFFDAA